MYPLHKYVPTPFGTYLMYINHGKERVTVENFPKDMKTFKKQLARNPKTLCKKAETKSRLSQVAANKQSSQSIRDREVRPSYQIHFLEHTGQTITEPPPNVIIVDDITGADVNSSMTWIRSRPQGWKERLKLHEIENPKMTSTIKPTLSASEILWHDENKLRNTQSEIKQRRMREVEPPRKPTNSDPVRSAMLPHVSKQPHPRRGREKREEREKAASKRRRRVDKIMDIVANRAQLARIKSQNIPDTPFEVKETRTSRYFLSKESGLPDHHRSLSVEPHLSKRLNSQNDEPHRSLSELSHNELRSRATTFDQKKTPKIQDWNPRKEHQLLNRIVLERLETTIPYKWKEEYKNSTKTQPQYHYVL